MMLTTGEAALLYTIIGKPDGSYPTVEEAINYMNPRQVKNKESNKLEKEEEFFEQLSFL